MGAMFITGICNNPFTLLAEQRGIALRAVNEDRCDLVTERERKVDAAADVKVEKHFNKTLDLLSEWRAGQTTDVSLEGVTGYQQPVHTLHVNLHPQLSWGSSTRQSWPGSRGTSPTRRRRQVYWTFTIATWSLPVALSSVR